MAGVMKKNSVIFFSKPFSQLVKTNKWHLRDLSVR